MFCCSYRFQHLNYDCSVQDHWSGLWFIMPWLVSFSTKAKSSILWESRWIGLFSCLKNSSRSPSLVWHAIYSLENSSESFLAKARSCLLLTIVLVLVENNWSLLRLIGSFSDFDLSTKCSFTNRWYWFLPISLILRTVSTAAECKISFVSKTSKSVLSSSKGFPSSSMTVVRARTSLINFFCVLLFCSWWWVLSFVLLNWSVRHWIYQQYLGASEPGQSCPSSALASILGMVHCKEPCCQLL